MNEKPVASGAQSANTTIVSLVVLIAILSIALAYALAGRSTDTLEVALSTAVPESATAKLSQKLSRDAELPKTPNKPATYTRSVANYNLPNVQLLDSEGRQVALTDELNRDGPVMMQFIFTTCPTICPVMSSTFAAVQSQLRSPVRLVSISIDPEHDTPARLREYAQRFRAQPSWRFLTGSRDSIIAVQRAFGAYQDNKMVHAPLTYLRESREHPWVCLKGLLSAQELITELSRATSASTSSADRTTVRQKLNADEADPLTASLMIGKRIYEEGILPSGQALRAVTLGDVVVEGTQVNCAGCLRRSGFAGGEEAVYVPHITGPALFMEREVIRAELFRKLFQDTHSETTAARVRNARYRPAYSDETLATAIRHGVDPTGRKLELLMPRYQLSDEDMGHLVAYLKSLFSEPAPGVDESTIHFATVVTEGVPDAKRRAMIEVLNAYVQRKNADTQGKLQHRGSSPLYQDEFQGAFRKWKLHVWDLRGRPETWGNQLEAYYRGQPVFALLSGMSNGSWLPVHDFCERTKLPCLFPHVDLPAVTANDGYTVYFSKGLTVEAQALARHLRDSVPGVNTERIVQVYRDEDRGRVLAEALRSALEGSALPNVSDQIISGNQPLTAAYWKNLVEHKQPSVLVLWLEAQDLEVLATSALDNIRQVYLSHGLLRAIPTVESAELREKIYMTYQFSLPGNEVPLIYRVRAWMRSRNVELTSEPIQLNTYFALSVTDHALVHLVEDFSRDYLIESIEHETEKSLNPGVFPHLSLGPGQRYASKGSYIVKLAATTSAAMEPVGDWIVP